MNISAFTTQKIFCLQIFKYSEMVGNQMQEIVDNLSEILCMYLHDYSMTTTEILHIGK